MHLKGGCKKMCGRTGRLCVREIVNLGRGRPRTMREERRGSFHSESRMLGETAGKD